MSARASRWTWALVAAALLIRPAALGGAACGARPLGDAVDADTAEAGSVGLLQHRAEHLVPSEKQGSKGSGSVMSATGKQPEKKHYWPHARGDVDHYSQTPYKIPMDFNESLLWKWDAPNYNTILWGVNIDADKNLYVSGIMGVWKFSPEGKQLWYAPMTAPEMPTLVGDRLVGMQMNDATAFALDMETGRPIWTKQVSPNNGAHGDFVEVHNGVAVVAMGAWVMLDAGGPSLYAAGINIENGDTLWKFKPDCGLWNIMALFPDEDTTIFNDYCGNVYRLGLFNGSLIWKSPGSFLSFTDGGSMIGPDGSTYTCSNQKLQFGTVGTKGVLRKHRLSDGELMWRVGLEYPCVNFPAVSADGRSVIVAPGPLADPAKTKEAAFMPLKQRKGFYDEQAALVANGTQRSFYHLPDLEAALMAFDTETGELQWRHDVYPYGNIAFAGDELRSWLNIAAPWFNVIPHCWPAHWSAPTVDPDGKIIIGRSSGELLAYDPKRDVETSYRTNDGALMGGAAFAPGIMAIATCSSVHVFKIPEA